MHIPNRDTAVTFFRHYLFLGAIFFVIYGGMNYLTSVRNNRYTLSFDWELQTPFVPGFVYVYLSIFLVFLLPLFYLSSDQIRALSKTFLAATVLAGIVYFFVPAELAFDRPHTVPGHEFVFKWLYTLALPHNLFPSLHVTYATLFIGLAVREERSSILQAGLAVWLLLLMISVLLVRQHHIVDIAGGMVLAFACYRLVYNRFTD